MTLRETNRDAFFGLLQQKLEALLPVIYTPTVAEACQRWSTLLHRPTGLYISTQDKARAGCQWIARLAKLGYMPAGPP
jgi:malic enzyme